MKRQAAIFDTAKRVGGSVGSVDAELVQNLGPIIRVSPSRLAFNDQNKDFREEMNEDFESFVEDIRINGIHDPVLIRPDYTLIAGERRTRAALRLGIESLEARIYYGEISEGKERKFIVRDNLQRRQLSPARKEQLVIEYYSDELKADNRGKRSGENLAKKVSKEMGVPIGTAKRVVAKARKVVSGKPIKKPKPVPEKVKHVLAVQGVLSALIAARRKASEAEPVPKADKDHLVKEATALLAVVKSLKVKK